MYRLEMAWQGPAADEFATEMTRIIEMLNDRAEEVVSMGLTLSHQGEMWDESDQRWTRMYRTNTR
jgi:uncharacterized protein YukE